MNTEEFLKQFHDFLAPKLDTYEQAIYLYVIRHSRLIGNDETVIGFKSARKTFAFGIGKKGTPMSEGVCYEKLQSLVSKKCLKIIGTERGGTRIRPYLPDEIEGLITIKTEEKIPSLDEMDFFEVPENRQLILKRESHKCFYCLRDLNNDNYVIEHVISRPEGDNSYRNVVAACLTCNNRKKGNPEDLLRTLYREGFLNSVEFEDRISHLERLKTGDLKPPVNLG